LRQQTDYKLRMLTLLDDLNETRGTVILCTRSIYQRSIYHLKIRSPNPTLPDMNNLPRK